mgnify:CR=1 FL=1
MISGAVAAMVQGSESLKRSDISSGREGGRGQT